MRQPFAGVWIAVQLGIIALWLMGCQPATASPKPPATFTPTMRPSAIPSATPTLQLAPTLTATATFEGEGRFVGTFGAGYFTGVFRSPDEKQIFVIFNGNELRWYDAKTLQQVGGLFLKDKVFNAQEVIFGPDTSLIVVLGMGNIAMIDLKNQKATDSPFLVGDGSLSGLQFSPDAPLLFFRHNESGNHGMSYSINAWDIQENKLVQSYWASENYESISNPAISSDGKWIVAGYTNIVEIRDVATGEMVKSFKGHKNSISAVAFSQGNDQIASADADGIVRLWDCKTGQQLAEFSLNVKFGIEKLSFSNQQLTITSEDGLEQVIDLKTGQVQPLVQPAIDPFALALHQQGYSELDDDLVFAISPDGKTLAVGSQTVLLWDIQTQKLVGVLENPSHYGLTAIKFDSTGRKLAGISGSQTLLWDLTASTQPNLATVLGPIDDVGWRKGLAFSNDGKSLAVGRSNSVELWDVETGQNVKTLSMSGKAKYVLDVQFLPDNQSLYAVVQMEHAEDAEGYSSQFQQWNFKIGQMIRSINFFGRSPDTSAFRWPFFAFMNGDNSPNIWVEIWNIETLTSRKLSGGLGTPTFFSRDGRLLFAMDTFKSKFSIWGMQLDDLVYSSRYLENGPLYLKYNLDLLSSSNFVSIHVYHEGVVQLFDISDIIDKARQP